MPLLQDGVFNPELSADLLRQGLDGVAEWNRLRRASRVAGETPWQVVKGMTLGFPGRSDLLRMHRGTHGEGTRALLKGVDFSHCDLRGVDLGNLRLRGCNFSHANLEGATLADSQVSSNLHGANLAHVDATQASLCRAKLSGAIFEHAKLASADLSGHALQDIRLSGAMLEGARFVKANGARLDFSGWRLRDTDWAVATLQGAVFDGADLEGARFSRADLTRASFKGAWLARAVLEGCTTDSTQLLAADLRGASLRGVNLSSLDLTFANLVDAQLEGAIFRGATLRRATMRGLQLQTRDLRGADLRGAHLVDINLSGANLEDARLVRARLERVHLDGARLGRARLARAVLTDCELSEADLAKTQLQRSRILRGALERARLLDTDLRDAVVDGCRVYGLSAWGVRTEGARQLNLVIGRQGEPQLTIDNLEVAQFVHLLLTAASLRQALDTMTSKVVLILGRFSPVRKAVLDAMREELRRLNYCPILFDFQPQVSRNVLETIRTLAALARFIVADLTDPQFVPVELISVVPVHTSLPVQPLLQACEKEPEIYYLLKPFPWFLELERYEDTSELVHKLRTLLPRLEEHAAAHRPQHRPAALRR